MQTDWSLSSWVSENSELILWILDDGNVPTDKLTNFFNKTAKVSASWNIYIIKVRKFRDRTHEKLKNIYFYVFFIPQLFSQQQNFCCLLFCRQTLDWMSLKTVILSKWFSRLDSNRFNFIWISGHWLKVWQFSFLFWHKLQQNPLLLLLQIYVKWMN